MRILILIFTLIPKPMPVLKLKSMPMLMLMYTPRTWFLLAVNKFKNWTAISRVKCREILRVSAAVLLLCRGELGSCGLDNGGM